LTGDAHEAAFAKLLADLPAPEAPLSLPGPDSPFAGHGDAATALLVESFLMWRSTPEGAEAACAKLAAFVVDFNELRVCLPEEVAQAIGVKFPDAAERAGRLRLTLNDIYQREHVTSIATAVAMPKREAKAYLDGLDGCPPFVAARVALIAVGTHAFPLDEPMAGALESAGALPPGLDIATASGWIERQIRAGEAPEAYAKLKTWATQRPTSSKSSGSKVKKKR